MNPGGMKKARIKTIPEVLIETHRNSSGLIGTHRDSSEPIGTHRNSSASNGLPRNAAVIDSCPLSYPTRYDSVPVRGKGRRHFLGGWAWFLISPAHLRVRLMGRTCRLPREIELTPIWVALNGSRCIPSLRGYLLRRASAC